MTSVANMCEIGVCMSYHKINEIDLCNYIKGVSCDKGSYFIYMTDSVQ